MWVRSPWRLTAKPAEMYQWILIWFLPTTELGTSDFLEIHFLLRWDKQGKRFRSVWTVLLSTFARKTKDNWSRWENKRILGHVVWPYISWELGVNILLKSLCIYKPAGSIVQVFSEQSATVSTSVSLLWVLDLLNADYAYTESHLTFWAGPWFII